MLSHGVDLTAVFEGRPSDILAGGPYGNLEVAELRHKLSSGFPAANVPVEDRLAGHRRWHETCQKGVIKPSFCRLCR